MKIRIAQNLFSSCIRYSAVLALALAIPVASNADFAKKAWHKLATHRLPICEAQTPPACDVELVIDAFDASCAGANDGILDMTILVGEAPFTIDWDNDGTGDNDDPQDLQDLPVGTYSVTVTDNNGCLGFASFDIFEPSAIDISGAVTDLSTPNAGDGAIDLNIVGGTLPYSYDWSYNGPSSGDPEDPNSLGAGTYSVTVTDANSCTNSASFTIEAPACGLDLNAAIASSNCFGSNDGKINLSVFGGQAPYLYDWSNDGTGDNDDDQDLHNLTPGSYSVTATDAGGCTGQATYQVTEPSDILLSANVGNASAIGANDGWIDLTATGSTPPYTYDWSNDGTGDNNDPQDLAALTAGTYTVTVTDAHNCSKTASYTITQPQAFDLALRKTLANGQPGTVAPGSTVTFTITVFNQGGIGATNVLVIDYLPTNLNFTAGNNPGWVNFGSGPTWFISSLPAGASVSRNIRLTVSANSPLTTLNNYAEITAADDNNPNTFDLPIDVDSKPNAFLFDDPGGQPNGPADNIITGNGTGLPGSSNPLTDEDDHDGAAIIVSIPSVTLGNLVFEDKNNDGLFNNNDAGIEGVEVKLYKAGPDFAANTSDDQFVATTTTNAQGEYFFMGLLDGYYFVKLSGTGIPVGFVSSTGDGVFDMDGAGAYEPAAGANLDVDGKDDGTQLGAEITSDVMLLSLGEEPTGGDVNNTLDFGLYLPLNLSSLGDFVWYDNDLDGQQDLGEPGVQGVKIRLFDLGTNGAIGGGDDNQIDFETTNSDGFYSFTNIVPNNYYLQLDLQTLPSNYLPTSQNQGNDATDSDFNAQGLSPVVTLLPGDANNSLDFGLKPLLSGIGNFVWNDLDHDGLQDFSESGVAGVIVKLYNLGNDGQQGGGDDALVLADTTNADGFYGFENLVPGNYYLQLDMAALPPGFLASPQNQGNDLIDSDATADGKTATITLSPGQTNTSLDFGIYEAIYDLSLTKSLSPGQTDTVDINDLVSYDITVTNQGNTAVQDIIVVDHIPAGLVFVQNNPGWTLHAADSASYFIAGPVQAGQSVTVPIRLLVQYGASGQTMVNRAEIIGVEDAFGNAVLDLDSTPDNGNPNEDDLSATAIELIPHDPTGWVYCDKTGRIITGGTISVTGPNGIPNSQVNIIHDGSSGYYEFFTNGTPGVYTISYNHPNGYPISGDCAPQPGPIDITGMPDPYVLGLDTVSAGQLSSVNCASNPYYLSFDIEAGDPVVYFNNLPLACTYIGSVVSEDANFNDQFDAADLPLPGVTVNLYDCADPTTPIANTTTDGAGRYRFDGLQPGNYQVGFAPVAGFRFVSTGNIDPSGLSNCTTLAWGECDTTLAITLYECPTVNAGPDRAHCFAADTSHLDAGLSHGTGNFTWTPAAGLTNANIANPIASPSANTSYIINFNDGFGCTDSDTIAVTVGSSTPFLVNSPFTDSTVACAPLPFELPVFGDVCDPNLIITSNTVITPITCGFIRRTTWTARNAIGNTASFTQTVTVDDNEAPTMNASHPFFGAILHGDTLYADCSQIPSLDSLGFGSFDNCSVPTVNFTENITNGSCPTDGFFQSRYCGWTSTDACGNVDSLYFTVIITDNLPPVLSPAPPDITVNCNAVPPAATLTATDNCTTGLTVTVADVSVADGSGCVTTIVRTWTVEDACGNMASASQTITVDDDTSPTLIGVPANAMLDCSVPVPPAPVVTATDACDNDVPVVPSQSTTGDPSTGCYSIVRTWRATDNCGNNVQRSQTLVFSDTTPPVLNGVPADQSYDCSTVVPSAAAVTATDNCDSSVPVVFSETINGNHTTGCFSISRTWRATDDCGNVATATQVVTVTDNTAPLLSGVPADLTLDCASPVPAAPAVTASDFCDGNIPVVFTENTNLTTACRVITRRWTATDDCGNTAIATQTITLRDTQAPVLSATPANASYTCLSEVPPVPTITATDNCDTNAPVLFFTSTIGNPAGCSFQIRRTWAVADDCNNATVWVQTITVNDNVPPSFATAIPANVSINCGTPLPAVPTITATDNCDANVQVTMTTAYLGDPTASCYILTRTWTATDDCGNSVSASQDIQVRDTEAPNFVGLPNNGTVDCDNLPGDNVTATDNCDNNVTVTISDNVQSSVLGCATQVVRTWTATDDCGNTRIASRTFNVQNTDAPAITIVEPALLGVQDGDVLYLECDALPSLTNTSAVATSDCCGAAAVVFHESATGADCATAGYYAVMQCGWVATDCCGNADSLFFTVYVIDNTPPEFFGVPANVELPLGSLLPPLASVFTVDNCDNSTPISYNQTTTGPADNQLTTRTWSATDNCGNTGIAVQTILIVDDNQAPLIANVPADMTIEGPIGSLPGGVDDVTVTDNRDDNPTVEYSEERTGGQCCYLLTRRWVAFDDFGNTSIAEQKITVTDTQAPVIGGTVADVNATCQLGLVPLPQLSASDNCTGNLALQFTADTLQMSCGYQIVRTWTATDECGNAATRTQTLTVEDVEGPSFATADEPSAIFYASQNALPNAGANIAEGQTIAADETWSIGNQAMASLAGIAADNCTAQAGLRFRVENIEVENLGCEQRWTVSFAVLDACGNASAANLKATATFVDDTAPVFGSQPQNLTVDCGNLPTPMTLAATDAFGSAVSIQFAEAQNNNASGGCPGEIVRTWTTTDACGNSAIAEQKINLVDNAAPVMANVPTSTLAACGNVPPAPADITATDNCTGVVPVVFSETINGGNNCSYSIVRTWSATDACGNSTIKQQYIWVADNTPPAIATNLPAELTMSCEGGLPPLPALAFSDNCDDSPTVELVETVLPGALDCDYSVLRKWTVKDRCGNASIAQQVIHLVDNTLPTLANLPADLTVQCGNLPALADVTATDNCDSDVLIDLKTTYPPGCPYLVQNTWKATDNCGNEAVAMQTITMVDTEAPQLSAAPADLVLNCSEHLPAPAALTAIDQCDNNVAVTMSQTVTPTPCGEDILRTWTATDDCGNTSTVSQLITRYDSQAPSVVEPADLTVGCGELPVAVQPVFGDFCDSDLRIEYDETVTTTACGEDVRRIWTAFDDCGNFRAVDQIIHVRDLQPPVLSFANPVLAGLSDGDTLTLTCENDLLLKASDVAALDACSNVNLGFEMADFQFGNCEADGYIVLAKYAWKATDGCGNEAVLNLNLKVVDNAAPVFAPMPDVVTVNCGEAAPDFEAPAILADCNEVAVSFASQTETTAYGKDIVGTWTAVDACGNAATTTQTMQVYSVGAAQLLGVPGDLEVDLSNGETLPAAATVTAIDNCSGDALNLIYEENQYPAVGCTTLVERRWSAVGLNGVTVSETQSIILTEEVHFTASMVADTCSSDNGSVTLAPANLNYAWFGIGTGANLTGLGAGIYKVTATNANGCSTTAEVEVAAVCNCLPAVVKDVRKNRPSCGENEGKVVIHIYQNPNDYDFKWVPDLGTAGSPGNSRKDLPPGHYTVYISQKGLADCVAKVEIDLDDDCANCGEIFTAQTAMPAGNSKFCLPVPFDLASNFTLKVNGGGYTGALEPCGTKPVKAYNYATVPVAGPYSVIWKLNGEEVYTFVSNMEELAGAMNTLAPVGKWYHSAATKQIVTTDLLGDYGQVSIRSNTTGTAVNLMAVANTASTGTLMSFGNGTHLVSMSNPATGCKESLSLTVNTGLDDKLTLPNDGTILKEIDGIKLPGSFSPNGDGVNDYLEINGLENFPNHELRVFNALGQLVFSTKNYSGNWGGSWGQNNLPSGTYFYLLESGKGEHYSGRIQIVR